MRINGSGLQDTNLAVTYINSIIVACLEQNCSMHCESLRAVRLGCKLAANNISTNLLTNGKHGLTLTPLIDTHCLAQKTRFADDDRRHNYETHPFFYDASAEPNSR